jgi:hypothetical protein
MNDETIRKMEEIVDGLKAASEPVKVFIVLEIGGGRDAVDGVHFDESAAAKRCEELNLRNDDQGFACVVTKYVRTRSGYLTQGQLSI